VQTFLPYFNFSDVAKCLDSKRLNKQIVEACQILDTLKKIDGYGKVIGKYIKTPAWVHHPAVLMWINYETALISYIWACVKEWEKRFKKERKIKIIKVGKITKPKWFTKDIIISHRSNLIRKSDFYLQYNWNVKSELPYYWPYRWNRELDRRIQIHNEDL
jgi:hypothetical protein